MTSGTYTVEYTVADIKRVLGNFAADLAMMISSSAVAGWSRSEIDQTVADLVAFADNGYLSAIDVTLSNGYSEVRAARYTTSTAAQGWSSDRPGDSLWPKTPGGSLRLTAVMSSTWSREPDSQKAAFVSELNGSWPDSDRDLSHRYLVARSDRRYASNAFGIERQTYGS